MKKRIPDHPLFSSPVFAAFEQAMRRAAASSPNRFVIALSGGLDSVCLTRLTHAWRERFGRDIPDIPIIAAHVNHQLRGAEADGDEQFCRELAGSLGIDFASHAEDANAVAKEERVGVEEAGRRIRYRFFYKVAGEGGVVLTGHHADDQVETILLNLRRGAHARGLAGIRETGVAAVPPGIVVKAVRPLLRVRRQALHELASLNDWRWREDASNAEPCYARNRIRLRSIPTLEKLMPGFTDRLLDRAELFRAEDDALTAQARRLLSETARKESGGIFLEIDRDALPAVEILKYALREIIETCQAAPVSSRKMLDGLLELAVSGRLNETVALSEDLYARREPDGLFFFSGRQEQAAGGEAPGMVAHLPAPPFIMTAYGLRIEAEWVREGTVMPDADRRDKTVQWLNARMLHFPLCLRPPYPGERFKALGAPGSRKVQDMLVDLKVPRRQRAFPRVLADGEGALWIWPYRMAERARVTEGKDAALRIRIIRVESASE